MNTFKRLGLAFAAFAVLGACQSGDSSDEIMPGMVATPYSRTAYPMGTIITLEIFDEGKGHVLDLAMDRILELEELLNVNEESGTENSEVELINANAGVQPVQVSEDTFYLIQQAMDFSHESGGIFNATIGALTQLWHIGFSDARRPADAEISATLPLLDFNHVALDETQRTVFLEETGMRFDLGAIAKGFIADEVVEVLLDNGVTSAVVNLGGDLFVIGYNFRGNPRRIGIQNPFSGRSRESVVTFLASDQAVVTSGVYERYFEYEGRTYHHILNAKTGFPFDNDVAGVTIVSNSTLAGDKYTTLAFGLGVSDGLAAIEALDGIEAIFINYDQEIFVTSGLRGEIRLENEEFILRD